MLWTLFSALSAVWTIEVASLTFCPACCRPLTCVVRPWLIAYPAASSAAELIRRPEDRRCIAVETALLELFRLICVCIADVLVRIERDIVTPPWCGRFGVVPRLLLAAGLSGYRPVRRALEGRPERSGHTRGNPVRSGGYVDVEARVVVLGGLGVVLLPILGDVRGGRGFRSPTAPPPAPALIRVAPGAVPIDTAGHRRRGYRRNVRRDWDDRVDRIHGGRSELSTSRPRP